MRIRLKLTVGFLIIGALVAALGYQTISTNRLIAARMEQLGRRSIVDMVDSHEMIRALDACRLGAHGLISKERVHGTGVSADRENRDRARRTIQLSRIAFEEALVRSRQAGNSLNQLSREQNDFLSLSKESKLDAIFNKIDDEFRTCSKLFDEFIVLAEQDIESAGAFLEDRIQRQCEDRLLPLIEEYKQSAERDFTGAIRAVERAIDRANARGSIAATATLVFAIVIGIFISQNIARPLTRLQDATTRLGKGHLDMRIAVHSRDEIGELSRKFNQMATDLQATTVSKTYVDRILHSMSEILIVTDAQGGIRKVNQATLDQLGFSEEELLGKPLSKLLPLCRFSGPTEPALRNLVGSGEQRVLSKNAEPIWAYCSVSELQGDGGSLEGFIFAALNIAERKRVEQQLRASLDEKEVLLKEVHHRVKNNLQIISSLLALQANESNDPRTIRMFQESRGRIRSMALIHEQLYQSEDLGCVDLFEYIQRLTSHLISSSSAGRGPVTLDLHVDKVSLPLNLAIPCGMIVNELICNALEHAFEDGRRGKIIVSFQTEQGLHRLTVADNGAGLRADGAQEKGTSLGLKVVHALAKQLNGELRLENGHGTRVSVCFAREQESG